MLYRRLSRTPLTSFVHHRAGVRFFSARNEYAAVNPSTRSGDCSAGEYRESPGGSYRRSSILSQFATVDPSAICGNNPAKLQNCVNGEWQDASTTSIVKDPMNGEPFILSPNTEPNELKPFIDSMKNVTKSGTHNIYKSPEKFLLYGEVNHRVAEALHDPDVLDFFVQCIQRVMPKSTAQAEAEVKVVRKFFENFSGDNVRLMMRGFVQAGDHLGQRSMGHRWPYGPVAVISPFNFPLEIPVMQFVAAAMVGNKPVVKPESRVGLPVDQFLRLMHHCGLPKDEIDLIHCRGPVMSQLLKSAAIRMCQFTGGEAAAAKVLEVMRGRVKLEDAGFDWKVLGPMQQHQAPEELKRSVEYVAWQCDQDAYALSGQWQDGGIDLSGMYLSGSIISGQKCSAQSMALVHDDWVQLGLLDKLAELAKRRSLADLTLSPVLSHTNEELLEHTNALLKIPGSELLFGGKPLVGHQIPAEFGSFEPTAVLVDLDQLLSDEEFFKAATTEVFGPFQVVVRWKSSQEKKVLQVLERIEANLTAAVVSSDPLFVNRILGNTVNGTTYAGLRARTTGAPQNHWFGPAGTPLAAGIGTPEAVLSTWTCHREIVIDEGPIPPNWTTPPVS